MILNILIGVIREIVSETTQKGKEEILLEKVDKLMHAEDGNIEKQTYETKYKGKLGKLKIPENVVENVFVQTEILNGNVTKKTLIAQLQKLLHPPETQDMLLAMKKLETFRHKLIQRCNNLPTEIPNLVQQKILSVVHMRAPDLYERLAKRLEQRELNH